MSTHHKKSKTIPAFLKKTYQMIQDVQNKNVIQWMPNGVGFAILNQSALTKKVLPKYFKHANYSSFIRQLNMYDFHKIRKGNMYNYFHHNYFIKNDLQSISQIRRKPQRKKCKFQMIKNNNQEISKTYKHFNKTQLTLQSTKTINNKSQQQIQMYQTYTRTNKLFEQIFDEDYDCEQQQLRQFQYSYQSQDNFQSDQKMSIHQSIVDQVQEQQVNEQIKSKIQQSEANIQANSNNQQILTYQDHHFNHLSLANYGLFI